MKKEVGEDSMEEEEESGEEEEDDDEEDEDDDEGILFWNVSSCSCNKIIFCSFSCWWWFGRKRLGLNNWTLLLTSFF